MNANKTTDTSFIYNHVRLSPEDQIPLHRQSSWEVTYVSKGSGMRLIGGQSEPFMAGEVILIPPEIPHCWYFSSKDTDADGCIENYTIMFDKMFLKRCSTAFPELSGCAEAFEGMSKSVKYNTPDAEAFASVLIRMRGESPSGRLASMIGLLPNLVNTNNAEAVGERISLDKNKERLEMIQAYVLCNIQRKITLEDIARHLGMNRSSFCAFFKRTTGMTFSAFLNSCRTDRVCKSLAETDIPISEACLAAGFRDIPYFNRFFKKVKGCTPSQYREQCQARHDIMK